MKLKYVLLADSVDEHSSGQIDVHGLFTVKAGDESPVTVSSFWVLASLEPAITELGGTFQLSATVYDGFGEVVAESPEDALTPAGPRWPGIYPIEANWRIQFPDADMDPGTYYIQLFLDGDGLGEPTLFHVVDRSKTPQKATPQKIDYRSSR